MGAAAALLSEVSNLMSESQSPQLETLVGAPLMAVDWLFERLAGVAQLRHRLKATLLPALRLCLQLTWLLGNLLSLLLLSQS